MDALSVCIIYRWEFSNLSTEISMGWMLVLSQICRRVLLQGHVAWFYVKKNA